MTKPDVILASPMIPMVTQQLGERFTVHSLWDAPDRDAMLDRVGGKVKAIALHGTNPKGVAVNGALMSRLPALEIVGNFGVGYNSIDAAWAAEHGVVVTNTPDVLNADVADVAVGLLIATLREIPQAERHLRDGKWTAGPYRLSPGSLQGRTVGIFGLGRIGKAIAKRLEGFGVTLAYCGRHKQGGVAYAYYPTLLQLAEACDVLIVMAPATPETLNAVDEKILRALGANGVLINMARGTLVNERDLAKALRERAILAAGLDVYVDEPNVPEDLMGLDNAVLLPHIGSASEHTRRLMGQLILNNLFAWFDGKPLPTPVPETPWHTRAERPALASKGV